MIPIWQLMMGICAGLVVLVLTRPQAIDNHHEERERHRRAQTHRPAQIHKPAQTPTKVEQEPKSKPGDLCVICMEEMLRHNIKYFTCTHAVHTDCFKIVEDYKRICPICQEPI